MKLLYLFIILLVFLTGFAQTPISLSGKVTDKSTGEGLSYATIRLIGTSIGTTTNQVGEFVFKIPANANSQLVVVSYLGYKSVEIKRPDLAQNQLIIALEPVSLTLKEVTVKPTNPLPIIERSIEKFARNYASKPYTAEGFQREYVTADRNVIQLLEVAFSTKGSKDSQSSTVLTARYLEDKKEKASLWNPSRGGFYTFGWTTVSGIEAPTGQTFMGVELKKGSDVANYYDFEFRKTVNLDDKEVYVIDFDQKKQVRKALLKGTLYIDVESDAIVKMVHEVSPRGLPFLKPHETWGGLTISKSPKRIIVQQDRWVTTYRQYGEKWYLNSLVIDTDFTAALVFLGIVQTQKNSLRLHSERIVTAIDTTNPAGTGGHSNIADVGSLPTLQNFIKKEYEYYDETRTGDWSLVNFIKSDTSIVQIAQRLKLNNQGWELDVRKRAAEKVLAGSKYTTRQLIEDIDYLHETLTEVHPGLDWYTAKNTLDENFHLIKGKLAKTNTEADFFRLLSPLIEQIHCGHTELYPSLATQEYNALYTKLFPLDLWFSDDSAIVTNEYEGIARGTNVVSINGYELPDVLKRIRPNIPSDGYNQTYKSFRLRNEFPILFARYIQTADTFDLKIKDANQQIRTLRIAGRAVGAKTIMNHQATARVDDSLHTLFLTIPSFSTDQDFPAFLEEAFRRTTDQRIKNLVIDLRNNQGGRDDYGALLYAYLADKSFNYYTRISVASRDSAQLNRLSVGDLPLLTILPDYLAHIQKKDELYTYTAHVNLATQQPKQNGFKGQVYVLINGGTFSSAAEFAAVARTNKRAIFIGQEAGGGYYGNCSLATPLLTLPNSKIRLAIPLAKYELAVAHDAQVGHGVVPDHMTIYTIGDILSNRDKDLELCFDLIKKIKN